MGNHPRPTFNYLNSCYVKSTGLEKTQGVEQEQRDEARLNAVRSYGTSSVQVLSRTRYAGAVLHDQREARQWPQHQQAKVSMYERQRLKQVVTTADTQPISQMQDTVQACERESPRLLHLFINRCTT